MVSTYGTLANPAIDQAADSVTTIQGKCKNGFDTALTHHSGTTDPSSGASWGSAQVGTIWKDTTDAQNPVWKQWQQTATSGPAYGWRTLRLRKRHMLTAPVAVTLADATPITADVLTFVDKDLTTELDTVQDNDDCLVIAVKLRVRVREAGTVKAATAVQIVDSGAAGTIGGLHFREKGTTVEQSISPQVSGMPVEKDLWIELDASEILQYAAVVGSASPSLAYEIKLVGYEEAV